MDEKMIAETVDEALAREFELAREKMTPDANLFTDLGLDSLDMVDMVIVLEAAFGVKLRDQAALQQIRTLGDIHGFVERKKRELEGQTG